MPADELRCIYAVASKKRRKKPDGEETQILVEFLRAVELRKGTCIANPLRKSFFLVLGLGYI
jgi:hypothetical protein